MSSVRWGASEEAFKVLHDAMQNLMAVAPGKKITKLALRGRQAGMLKQ